jgi:hypothetical protein
LREAGARLRARIQPLDPARIQLAALQRRSRRAVAIAVAAAILAVAVGAAALVAQVGEEGEYALGPGGLEPRPAEIDEVLDGLDDQPVDPTKVQLVSTVATFADCDALIADLRRVGAAHVGSRGFGGDQWYGPVGWAGADGYAAFDASSRAMPVSAEASGAGDAPAGETLGTNVQVVGVDELDHVKAEGRLIYDLDHRGDLRITDVRGPEVRSTLDVTPEGEGGGGGAGEDRSMPSPQGGVSQLLVRDGRVVLFGTETEVSEPVEGDPSATRSSTSFLTVTFVDATDPSAPTVTDRVRVEGSLVSARLVGDEVRLVTTSNMSDLGFVMPTTPASVPIALEQNRRTVAASSAADWIPDWSRDGEDAQALVPCERVHVPETFAGVAMTSMVTFPAVGDRFEPAGTSILAPGTTLYAGVEKVAISSEVWVDPIDRERLEFDDWQTAVHEFGFAEGEAPGYVGSGVVDGSTVGQFAFGEIGDSLAVVATSGTPWAQDPEVAIALTVLTPDGEGTLDAAATVEDLADGQGQVSAVRFVEGRVLVSTGPFGRAVLVIDVSDPAAPRRAGQLGVPGSVSYFHPLPDGQALLVANRLDEVGSGDDRRARPWVQAHLLDVSDPDAPAVLATWERPWTTEMVGGDHHAFTYWPARQLAMWGLRDASWDGDGEQPPNAAVVLSVDGGVREVAVPTASKPPAVDPPCGRLAVSAEVQQMVGRDGVVLRCDDPDRQELTWPRYDCFRADRSLVARYAPGEEDAGAWFVCNPAPQPSVARVLVVDGTPVLHTDQTLEALDPETFAARWVVHHPSSRSMGW